MLTNPLNPLNHKYTKKLGIFNVKTIVDQKNSWSNAQNLITVKALL